MKWWFKNVRIYNVTLENDLLNIFNSETRLEECIAKFKFRPTGQQEISSCGFSPIFGRHTEAFTYSTDHNHFFLFTEENKLLPGSVIAQVLMDEIDAKELELNRPLKKTEKAALKTAITNKMMAQAFASRRQLMIWVNSRHGYVGVSASSAKRAESALTLLRKALGSFPAKSFQPRCVVEDRMTGFVVKHTLPDGFFLGNDTVLKSTDDTGATVRVSKEEDLTIDEVTSHIKAGKVVTELQLNFDNRASFVLANDLAVKRLTLEDDFLKESMPQKSEDEIADQQACLFLEGDTLTNLVAHITKAFDCD